MDEKGVAGQGLIAIEFADERGHFGRFDKTADGWAEAGFPGQGKRR